MMTSLILPARLDTPAASTLAATLRKRVEAGQPLALDGTMVETIGQACLQVLAGARATALAKGLGFSIDRPSPALAEGFSLAGWAFPTTAA